MKNVMIFLQPKSNRRWDQETLERYIKAQIDNSLRFSWKPEDLIIATNFDFEYLGIKSKNFGIMSCEINPYYNKWFGLFEISNSINEDIWFHDTDSWQIHEFSFPPFDNQIGCAEYVYMPEYNTCSMFIKASAAPYLKTICYYFTDCINVGIAMQGTDEDIICSIRRIMKDTFSTINNEYNVGFTKMEYRYNAANKPVKIIGFKPSVKKDYDRMSGINDLGVDLIDRDLNEIFEKHRILPNEL